MNMNAIKVWPFLVSRNRDLDYRTVVAPEFICKAGIPNLLARVADGDLTESGQAFIRRIIGSKAGNFTIIFQVVKAKEKQLDLEGGDEILKDRFGREIYLIEGIVFEGKGEAIVTQEDIEKAHKRLRKDYRQFWEWSEPRSAISSRDFYLGINGDSIPLKLEELEPFQSGSKTPQRVSSVAILVAVTAALAFLLLAIGIVIKVQVPLVTHHGATTVWNCDWFIDGERSPFIVTGGGEKSIYQSQSIKKSGHKLPMKYHPSDQAIEQFGNQKVTGTIKKVEMCSLR